MTNPIIKPVAPADTQSANIIDGNLAQLKTLFPEAFKEGGVDFEVLKQLLGGQVDEREEKYGLNWHGKRRARQIALTPSTGTLRPCPGESVDWDTTQNLMIEGDNLEVLKLLQKSYAGKVKMIYIDPPYNTGKDFVYPDNFTDNIKNYLELTGQTDGEGRKLSSNTEANGRFHTDWLNMMYPRLKLARNLLREDGVIFVSLDDGETSNLRKICDEVFGEENFIAGICHKARASVSNDKIISSNHNIVTLYAKNLASVFAKRDQFGLEPNLEGFNLKDDKGEYKHVPVDGPGGAAKGNPFYSFEGVTGYWRFSEETMKKKWNDGAVIKVGNGLQQKYYLSDARKSRQTDTTWWDDGLYTSSATAKLKALMEGDVFSNPKPVDLVRRVIRLWARDTDDLVIDFFAGSGTTGHAVIEQSAIDGVARRYVLVQMPERLDGLAAAQKISAEYCDKLGKPRNIAELTKERLRRAATKIGAACARNDSATAQLSLESEAKTPQKPLDLGFKVFKLDTSNIRAWNPNPDELAGTLMAHTEHLAAGRTEADVLYEVLLKQGLDLAVQVQRQVIAGHAVYSVGAGALLVCLARDGDAKGAMAESTVTTANAEALALGIADWHTQLAAALGQTPAELHTRVVLRDSLFDGDVAKTNLTAILRQRGLEDVRSL